MFFLNKASNLFASFYCSILFSQCSGHSELAYFKSSIPACFYTLISHLLFPPLLIFIIFSQAFVAVTFDYICVLHYQVRWSIFFIQKLAYDLKFSLSLVLIHVGCRLLIAYRIMKCLSRGLSDIGKCSIIHAVLFVSDTFFVNS